MGRAPCCDKANVKKGPWSPEEDAKLKAFIEQSGTGGNWIALPQKAGLKRCGKSCRLRWLNYLRPDIRHGGFSEEEDSVICSLYANIGSRWSIIAAQLPGRTDNDIKNYWNTRLKKKLLGKRRELQNRRLKVEAKNNIPRGVCISEGMSAESTMNAIRSLMPRNEAFYVPDPLYYVGMDPSYAFGHSALVNPQALQHAAATSFPNCSNSEYALSFGTDPSQALEGLIMSDSTILRKLIMRNECALSECSTNNTNNNGFQSSSSNVSSHMYSPPATFGHVAFQESLEKSMKINVKSEPVGVFNNNDSMTFRDSSSSSTEGNHFQPAWLHENGLSSAQDQSSLSYEFPVEQLNELMYLNNYNSFLEQKEDPCDYSSCRDSAPEETTATCWPAQLLPHFDA
ncbi:hypothetical protein SUGI_0848550 [Cryptomeria japonica]|uniref:transcription factor MYB87 n=1 Tax=Cryptomeria japonica TaxID=3369 RepID=UPI00241491AC|nr:transcription factor MYB87 [Cryptomeria japonica]GLJ40988.1 hypothetical protein SUGI_0848550 [Cryptomeria japonica]